MLELSDKDFQAAIIKSLYNIRAKPLAMNGKIVSGINIRQKIKEKNGNFITEKYNKQF